MDAEYAGLLDELLEDDSDTMTAWEVEFIESLNQRRDRALSEKQETVLTKIWDKKTMIEIARRAVAVAQEKRSLAKVGIAERTRRLLRGRIQFVYDRLRGGDEWHIRCDGYGLCDSACWMPEELRNHIPGETELPTPLCYGCFVMFNSPTIVVLMRYDKPDPA